MKTYVKEPTKEVLQNPQITEELIKAHRLLGELKGLSKSLPNDNILIHNLTLQEAQESSAIENIITTLDSLYEYSIKTPTKDSTPNKEVHNYSKALIMGFNQVKDLNGLSINIILEIQKVVESKKPGFRKIPGTVIKNMSTNEIVHTPPPPNEIEELMSRLEKFINSSDTKMDPLICMSLIRHWFESIHPFYDGNGRTGRIINILYLILKGVLDSPILYLSRYINNHRSDYYRLLRKVREEESWEEWLIYMLKGVTDTSQKTLTLIKEITSLFSKYKEAIRDKHKFYSHELINSLFSYPYITVEMLENNLKDASRATATRYLDALSESDLLKKDKLGKKNYYINSQLFELLKNS